MCIILQELQTYFDLLTKVHNFEVELYEKVCLCTHGHTLKNVATLAINIRMVILVMARLCQVLICVCIFHEGEWSREQQLTMCY